ncbi:GPI mannosyltransferase 2 [Clohesyomyces aquaticus]|uniref:GPI mannosyltransferase 2 n=1 Tax=Clohesyomyces aquaticus TaxID=1231657 RepID=A0A1Y1ZS61_9PLEO|nr:GPI mannosyltransferase 2 [Clohesyomyces aquaticus]
MSASFKPLPRNVSRTLLQVFLAWKSLLILIAAFTPGPGYDTSAFILYDSHASRHVRFHTLSRVNRLSLNLFRWDALYFVKAAQRGYVHEQEWAFSWTYTRVLSFVAHLLTGNAEPSLRLYIWTSIVISNLCHFVSVLALYQLLKTTLSHNQPGKIPLVAAILHIMSPAGMFLCAPYTEAPFSALSMLGILCYVLARESGSSVDGWSARQDLCILASGILLAVATMIRGNGLLNGLVFLYDVLCFLPRLSTLRLSMGEFRRILATSVAGVLIAFGYFSPQWLAYKEYCVTLAPSAGRRPWCNATIPSIYSWVQSNYWNVGFLRYWTFSNLPLFLLAAPTLWLLFQSSTTILYDLTRSIAAKSGSSKEGRSSWTNSPGTGICKLPQLALPQLALAVLAATNFHVQIVSRLASGYPIWYLVVAKWAIDRRSSQGPAKQEVLSQWVIRWMIMYSVIQGILFANFLPPA